jgi:hypothetical protein
MLLGEVLIRDGSVSADGVEEALMAQALRGGRLGTNLLELGLISEPVLAQALGAQHQLPHASGELEIDAEALRRMGSRLADDKDLLPVKMDSLRLPVAVIDPCDVEALDAVARKTGRSVMPVVVPEVRLNRLLTEHCGAIRDARGGRWALRRRQPLPEVQGEVDSTQSSADLMDEQAFEALYLSPNNTRNLPPVPRPKRSAFSGRMFIG